MDFIDKIITKIFSKKSDTGYLEKAKAWKRFLVTTGVYVAITLSLAAAAFAGAPAIFVYVYFSLSVLGLVIYPSMLAAMVIEKLIKINKNKKIEKEMIKRITGDKENKITKTHKNEQSEDKDNELYICAKLISDKPCVWMNKTEKLEYNTEMSKDTYEIFKNMTSQEVSEVLTLYRKKMYAHMDLIASGVNFTPEQRKDFHKTSILYGQALKHFRKLINDSSKHARKHNSK